MQQPTTALKIMAGIAIDQTVLDDGLGFRSSQPLKASDLKLRGWTETMIKRFLKPASYEANPYYSNAPKMRLYRLGDVESAENTEEFALALEKARRASEGAMIASANKIQSAAKVAMDVTIPFPTDQEAIRAEAIRLVNKDGQTCFAEMLFTLVQKKTLELIMQACEPAYWEIDEMYGQKGAVMARKIIDKRIDDLLKQHYPALSKLKTDLSLL